MKDRLRRAQKGKKEEDRLVFLLKVPWLIRMLDGDVHHKFWSGLEKILFSANFGNCTHRKSSLMHSATTTALFLGAPNPPMS